MPTLTEVGIGLIIALLMVILGLLIARRTGPQRLDGTEKQMLMSLKESTDQRLPLIEKTGESVQKMLLEADKQRQAEEKRVRETLAALQEITKPTPEVAKKVAVLEEQLKRLQIVESGVQALMNLFLSTQGRGQMGEEAVQRVFENLPTDLWDAQYVLNGQKVDFVIHMPNGRVLPIDSKTSGLQQILEYYDVGRRIAEEPNEEAKKRLLGEQGKLYTKVRAAVLAKADEVAGYIQPENGTLGMALQAVPDSLFGILDMKTRKAAADLNVQVVPYALMLPVINVLRSQNQYERLDFQAVVSAMEGIRLQTQSIQTVLENKFDKAQKFISSGIKDVEDALASIGKNAAAIEKADPEEPSPAPRVRGAVVRIPKTTK